LLPAAVHVRSIAELDPTLGRPGPACRRGSKAAGFFGSRIVRANRYRPNGSRHWWRWRKHAPRAGASDALVEKNAAIANSGRRGKNVTTRFPKSEWERLFRVNVKGTFGLACKTGSSACFVAGPAGGAIVNIWGVGFYGACGGASRPFFCTTSPPKGCDFIAMNAGLARKNEGWAPGDRR